MASSAWIQEVVAQYLANGRYQQHVPRIRAAYGARCDALAQALGQYLDGRVTFRKPEGGMFFRSEEHTSELQSLMRISYAVFCLKKKRQTHNTTQVTYTQ